MVGEISTLEKDIIQELSTVCMGAAATALSAYINAQITTVPPQTAFLTREELQASFQEKGLLARITYKEGLQGQQWIFLPQDDASRLASMMIGADPPTAGEIGEMELSALQEAVGTAMSSYITGLAGLTGSHIDLESPVLELSSLQEKDSSAPDLQEENWVTITFVLEIEAAKPLQWVQIIPEGLLQEMINPLLSASGLDSPGEMPQDREAAPAAGEDTGLVRQEDRAAGPGEASLHDSTAETAPAQAEEAAVPGQLNEMQRDALAEVGNISLGSSATALATLINRRVQITTPRITLTNMNEVRSRFPVPCLVVKVNYIKGLEGENILIIKEEDALVITGLMMGLEPPEKPEQLDELELSAVSEAMNQMMGSAATAMSDFFDRLIDISPPELSYKDLLTDDLETGEIAEESTLVQVSFRMEVEDLIDSEILQLIPLEFAEKIASYLLSSLSDAEVEDFLSPLDQEEEREDHEKTVPFAAGPTVTEQPGEIQVDRSPQERASAFGPPGPSAETHADTRLDQEEHERLDMIRDIPVEIMVVLGRTRIPLRVVTSLHAGDVVSLDRYVGEPIEIFANERLVARGEVVMVNGQFGVKITSIFKRK